MPATRRVRSRNRSVAFSQLITDRRRQAGLTQAGLAASAGIDRTTIVKWETSNTVTPDPDSLRAVCRVLGIRYTGALIALGQLTEADLLEAAA